MDRSRRDFVEENARTIFHLVRGMLANETRHNKALIGRKNIGKTRLLSAFACAVRHVAQSGLFIIELSCDVHTRTPRQTLCERLKLHADTNWESIQKKLVKKGMKVLFIIDEFNLIYTNLFKNGEEYVREVLAIGGDKSGLYHCILSGSSSLLRRLITAKVTPQEKANSNLVNYTGVDLNGTKYSVHTILPFNHQKDLENLVDFFMKLYGRSSLNTPINIQALIIETGGYPGLIQNYVRTQKFSSDKHTIGLRSLTEESDPEKHKLLNDLKTAVTELQSSRTVHRSDTQSEEFTWVELVDVDNFARSTPNSRLYELADLGYLVFIEEGLIRKAGFFSSRIYLELVAQSGSLLTMTELMALRNPVFMYAEKAEFVMAKVLMQATSLLQTIFNVQEIKPYSEGVTEIPELLLPSEAEHGKRGEEFVVPRDMFLKECLGTCTKRDTLGADLVFVETDGTVHRVQLKLGTSTIQLDEDPKVSRDSFASIANNFRTKMDLARAAYARAGLSLNNCRHYLLTTRNFRPTDGDMFERGFDGSATDKAFVLIGNKTLKEFNVWPDQAKDLGKPFK
jgi:hypothetical protein